MTAPATFLVLTEDGSKDAFRTWKALAAKLLFTVDGGSRSVPHCVFEPANSDAEQVMRRNDWRSEKQEQQPAIVALVRSIANKLSEPVPGFVLFHFDGDKPWGERERCDKLEKFDLQIRIPVQRLLKSKSLDDREVDRRMSKLLAIVPYYSIEAWLYQNTKVAIDLCNKHYRGQHVAVFQGWAANRALLDEQSKPKDAVCLKGKHNVDLASQGFPAREVLDVGKSFAAAASTLRACAELVSLFASSASPS